MTDTTARIALVGDRSPQVRAHGRIPGLLAGLREHDRIDLDAYWLPTEDLAADPDLAGFDGIWLLPGSPYRSEAGAVAAVRAARVGGIPFLGTCGGFQHAVLEYARNVCALPEARHAEYQSPAGQPAGPPVISLLACSLVGHEAEIRVVPGTLAERVLGTDRTVERYLCAYGPDPHYLDLLTGQGLRFGGHDPDGQPRMLELPGHPFYLATLFQPELSTSLRPHPVIRAFATAALHRAAARATTAAPG